MNSIEEPRAMYGVLLREPFKDLLEETGTLKVVQYKVDTVKRAYKYVKFRMKSLHQALTFYLCLWKKWQETGYPFDRYVIVKEGQKYFVEVYLAPVADSRLLVEMKVN